MRFVHINGLPWKYNIGGQYINIWNPFTKKRVNVSHTDIVPHYSYDDNVPPIGPSDIKHYITRNILLTPFEPKKEKYTGPKKQPLTLAKVQEKVDELIELGKNEYSNKEFLRLKINFLMKRFIRHVAEDKGTYIDNVRKMAREIVKLIDV